MKFEVAPMSPFNFLLIFALLNLAFSGSRALTKEEIHWKSVFPNAPMPQVLRDFLPRHGRSTIFRGVNGRDFGDAGSDWIGDDGYDSLYKSKGEESPTNKGHVNDDSQYADDGYDSLYESKGEESPTNIGVNDDSQYADDGYDSLYESRGEESPTNIGVNDDAQYAEDGYDSLYESKGNKYSSGRKSDYGNAAAIKETIYFFQDDLQPGRKLNLPRLTRRSNRALFLPEQMAESMPISRDKLPEILKNFSVKADSSYAKKVKRTVMSCERAEIRGEEKYCATSFESFVDLAVSMLGQNIRLLSHRVGKGLKTPLFTIGRGVRDMGDNNIVCHKMNYPYAVYLCHSIKKTTVYEVPLMSMDGTKVNSMAVCHKDTSAWSPKHIAFQYLKVKPGSGPICHVLDRDTVVWVAN